jgi:hypothetical protein
VGEGTDDSDYGWFLDDVRPALAVGSPRPGMNNGPLSVIRIGVADAYTGIATGSLSIKADFVVNGRPAGSELVDLAQQTSEGIYALNLATPVANLVGAHLFVQVVDQQGNITRVDQKFSIGEGDAQTPTPSSTPPTPTPTATPVPTRPGGVESSIYLPVVQH